MYGTTWDGAELSMCQTNLDYQLTITRNIEEVDCKICKRNYKKSMDIVEEIFEKVTGNKS
jgi:hypothetical protein